MTNREVSAEWAKLARDLGQRDLRLAAVIRQVGMPKIELERNPYRALAESILSQQLATAAARSIIRKFRALESPFPRPETVRRLSPNKLRGAGVSAQKVSYLKSLSKFWTEPEWRRGWNHLSDGELVERLTQVKGIGVWTADMFMIFSLGRTNVLPTLDFGVQRGLKIVYGLAEHPKPKDVASLLRHWDGAYSVGAWYLWRAIDLKQEEE